MFDRRRANARMLDQVNIQASSQTLADKASALLVMMFGVFLLLGIGFANSTTIHNAAHDSRHANVFPCH